MKRVIKFRGLDKRNQWHHGDYFADPDQTGHFIREMWFRGVSYHDPGNDDYHIIDTAIKPETLGQYTGLKDITGVDVYEGDVIMFTYKTGGGCFSHQGKVIFEQYMFLVEIENGDYFSLNRIGGVNIIGNIHENAELL